MPQSPNPSYNGGRGGGRQTPKGPAAVAWPGHTGGSSWGLKTPRGTDSPCLPGHEHIPWCTCEVWSTHWVCSKCSRTLVLPPPVSGKTGLSSEKALTTLQKGMWNKIQKGMWNKSQAFAVVLG